MARKPIKNLSGPKPDIKLIKKENKDFRHNYFKMMNYCHYEMSLKELKKETIKYIKNHTDQDSSLLTLVKDYNFAVFGKLCYVLNHGGDLIEEAQKHIEPFTAEVIAIGEKEVLLKKEQVEQTVPKEKKPNIQDYMRNAAGNIAQEFDAWVDEFMENPKTFKVDDCDPHTPMKVANLKAGHARHVIIFYQDSLNEIQEAIAGTDEDLKEAYSQYSKAQLTRLVKLYEKIISAAKLIQAAAKSAKKPKARKAPSHEKLIAKLTYKKEDTDLAIASANPINIIEAKEVWVYNTKYRKLGKFIAFDSVGLSVKGKSIINFSEKSVEKTLRKPKEQMKEFNNAGKIKLRTFMSDIKTTETKLKGRISEHTLILKIIK